MIGRSRTGSSLMSLGSSGSTFRHRGRVSIVNSRGASESLCFFLGSGDESSGEEASEGASPEKAEGEREEEEEAGVSLSAVDRLRFFPRDEDDAPDEEETPEEDDVAAEPADEGREGIVAGDSLANNSVSNPKSIEHGPPVDNGPTSSWSMRS